MKRLLFLIAGMCPLWLSAQTFEQVEPGVYLLKAGTEDAHTPLRYKEPALSGALSAMPPADNPFKPGDIHIMVNERGCVVELPLSAKENIYGFGLQMGSFLQNDKKKRPVINDHPLKDLGYTHAPQPYYISTKGYCVVINTARYTTFYMGTNRKNKDFTEPVAEQSVKLSTDELYRNAGSDRQTGKTVQVDIPGAKGISVLVFSGPDMESALRRYNLYSGGGSLPAMWGLGVKYRLKADAKQADVVRISDYFRSKQIPCDVIGLEPKWQTRAYSCSFVWNKAHFPQPEEMIREAKLKGFKLNLWEHAFTHPTSPMYDSLKHLSGDHLVWNGLVPDFADERVRKLFGDYHYRVFVKEGISAFKLDECDNSDITRGDLNWSFPELSQFPSGLNGEQMHHLLGNLYQKTIYDVYRNNNMRTYLDVRASGLFAAPYPASLYSDTYDSLQYVRMINNSGLSGLLWSPEIRESGTRNEFFRRVHITMLSAQTLFNSWYLKNPPWLQFDKNKNNADILLPDAVSNEEVVRKLMNFRMSLVPYLYARFARYRMEGIPPFKPLVLSYPNDTAVVKIDDQYLIGDDLLACPVLGEGDERTVYLPEGNWYNYNTNQKLKGGRRYKVSFRIDEIPIFVREGTILPLAEPVQCITSETVFRIHCIVYGKSPRPAVLFEDDGETYGYEKGQYNLVELKWNKKGSVKRTGKFVPRRYEVKSWTVLD